MGKVKGESIPHSVLQIVWQAPLASESIHKAKWLSDGEELGPALVLMFEERIFFRIWKDE